MDARRFVTGGASPRDMPVSDDPPGLASPPVAIVGAGPVGAVAALALGACGVPSRLFDARAPAAGKADRRAIALSWGTRLALDRLGVWARIARADPITRVSVSERGAFGSIEFTADDLGTPALGFVVDYGDLARACSQALEAAGIVTRWRTVVSAIESGADAMTLVLAPDGAPASRADARCVVLADGAEGLPGGGAAQRSDCVYRQVALVGEVASEGFCPGRAHERFTGSGPLALLPRDGHHSCVWVLEPDVAQRLIDTGPDALARALESAAGPAFGTMRWLTVPVRVPLALRRAGRSADPRIVPIGNASQVLHPVAGQGFNLGVRDALDFASAWPVRPGRAGLPADVLLRALADFAQARRADRALTITATDLIARVTAIDNPLAAAIRGFGLSALDLLPQLRRRALQVMVFGAA